MLQKGSYFVKKLSGPSYPGWSVHKENIFILVAEISVAKPRSPSVTGSHVNKSKFLQGKSEEAKSELTRFTGFKLKFL